MSNFLPVNQLDFNTLRSNLKTYLQNQDRFKDYDFEGSNISVLLDILAYNTYQNAFYLNMIGNEMFLDTATLRDSIVSHAKELNYLPKSYTSATATLQLKVNVTNNSITSIIVPQNYRFISTTTTNTYTFSTPEPYIISRNSNNEFITLVDVKEGYLVSEKYIVNTSISDQRYVATNNRIDTDSIEVFVSSSTVSNDNVEFLYATDIIGLNSNSNIYFLQGAENGKYEVVFGDGVIGKKLNNGNLVTINYRVASGNSVNGLSTFTPQSNIDGYTVNIQNVVYPASGGAERESEKSIKYNAVKYFQTQNRTITKDDYKSLITANFPEIKAVNVYGGEEIPNTPQYGRVVISAITQTGDFITQSTADRVLSFVRQRCPLSINPVIINPETLDIIITTDIKYDIGKTTLTSNQIKSLVYSTISNFNNEYLLDFNKTFRYSKLVGSINNTHSSIASNETSVLLAKTIIPPVNSKYSVSIDFSNSIKRDDYNLSRPSTNEFTLYSSQFTYNSRPAYFGEDGAGKIIIYEIVSTGRNLLNLDAGSIDYDLGIINLNDIVVSNFSGDGITFFAIPTKQDITAQRNTIIQINNNLTTINVEAIKE